MAEIIEGKFGQERPDNVWICPECEGQEWYLVETGYIKCCNCKRRGLPPPAWLEIINKD